MLMYLVRGSVYTPEVMKGQFSDFDLGYDEIFFRLGADILHKIEQGEIDPTPFLNKKHKTGSKTKLFLINIWIIRTNALHLRSNKHKRT